MEKERIIRTTDDVGRVVLPAKWRKSLGLNEGDEVLISTHEQFIIIEKQEPCCIFCGSKSKLFIVNDKSICQKCITQLRKQA